MEELIIKKRGAFLGSPTPNDGPLSGSTKKASAKELIGCSPNHGGKVEITLTYPHTAAYLRMNSMRQMKLLSSIYRNTCAAVPLTHHLESKHYFEYDSHGQVYLHGYLILSDSLKLFPLGLISDMAKACLAEYPKKYNRFIDAHVYSQYTNYRCPQCKIQYRYLDFLEDMKRFDDWVEYCVKLQ